MNRVVVTGGFRKLGKRVVAQPSQLGWSVASKNELKEHASSRKLSKAGQGLGALNRSLRVHYSDRFSDPISNTPCDARRAISGTPVG